MSENGIDNVDLNWTDENGRQVVLSDLIADVRVTIRQDRPEDAFNMLLDTAIYLAEHLHRYGAAEELTQLLRDKIPSEILNHERQAWLLNLEGLIRLGQGQLETAETAFLDMRALGREISDKVIELTAAQNLGIVAFESGDFDEARLQYTEGLRDAIDIGDYFTATQLLLNLSTVAQGVGDFDRSEGLLSSVGETLSEHHEPRLAGAFHLNSGNLAAKQRRFVEAEEHFREALAYARRTGEQSNEIFAIQNLGNVYFDQGLPGKAMRRYRQAIRVAEKTNATSTLEALFRLLAMALHQAGRYQEAANNLENARTIAHSLGEQRKWAQATADLGAILLEMSGDDETETTELAKAHLSSALEVLRNVGDTDWQALVLSNLAEANRSLGDPEGAAVLVEEALQLIAQDDHDRKAALLQRIAEAWAAKREGGSRAVEYFERMIDEHRKLDSGSVAWYTNLSALTLAEFGHSAQAVSYYNRAIELYEQAGDDQMAFHTRNDRGIAFSSLGRLQEAREDFHSCLTLAKRLEDRVMEQQASLNLGEIARREMNVNEAIQLLERAVSLSKDLADQEKEAESLGNLGIALREADRVDEAEAALRTARDLARRLRNPAKEALAVGGLAGVAFVRGHFGRAARSYSRAEKLNTTVLDFEHALEDRAGVVESLSAQGRSEYLHEEIQRLVDLAEELNASDFGGEALARSARWWLRHNDFDEAAKMYAIAIILAGSGGASGSGEEMLEQITLVMSQMVVHVGQGLVEDQDAFYEQVIAAMNEYEGTGDLVRGTLSTVRQAVENLDIDIGDSEGSS